MKNKRIAGANRLDKCILRSIYKPARDEERGGGGHGTCTTHPSQHTAFMGRRGAEKCEKCGGNGQHQAQVKNTLVRRIPTFWYSPVSLPLETHDGKDGQHAQKRGRVTSCRQKHRKPQRRVRRVPPVKTKKQKKMKRKKRKKMKMKRKGGATGPKKRPSSEFPRASDDQGLLSRLGVRACSTSEVEAPVCAYPLFL